jgi:hypothetical protein
LEVVVTQDSSTRTRPAPRRLAVGAGWGVAATVVMSALMIAAVLSGISPMPKPIPVALVARTLGGGLPMPALIALGALAHLAYGAAAGAVLAGLIRHVTVAKALAYGVLLWALMDLVWLPYLGWGILGTAITAKIALATLVLHLLYGLTLGLLLDRTHTRQHAAVAH